LDAVTHPIGDATREAVAQVLPAGARAIVVLPNNGYSQWDSALAESSGGTAGSSRGTPVLFFRQPVDAMALLNRVTTSPGAVATASTPDGVWVAVATPLGGSSVAALAAAVMAGLAVVAGATFPQQRPHVARATPGTGRRAAADAETAGHRARGHRELLIQRFADLIPQLSDGLAWHAVNALSAVDVRAVVPDGARFDPGLHHAVGTEVTSEAARIDTVARTVRPGYRDGNRIVVYPKVVVYVDSDDQGKPA
jgi:hypothetical protein